MDSNIQCAALNPGPQDNPNIDKLTHAPPGNFQKPIEPETIMEGGEIWGTTAGEIEACAVGAGVYMLDVCCRWLSFFKEGMKKTRAGGGVGGWGEIEKYTAKNWRSRFLFPVQRGKQTMEYGFTVCVSENRPTGKLLADLWIPIFCSAVVIQSPWCLGGRAVGWERKNCLPNFKSERRVVITASWDVV